jgi:hypothetical protein
MKKFIVLILISLFTYNAFTQQEEAVDSPTTKKLTKEQKKEQRLAQEASTAKLVEWMVEQRRFVLEADYLSNETGQRFVVPSNLNFIKVDSSEITIQIASNTGSGGPNAMGGITTDGTVSDYQVKRVGKTLESYSIRLFASTGAGFYEIFMNISSNGLANATISGLSSGKLNYHGEIVPLYKSRVFKGRSI